MLRGNRSTFEANDVVRFYSRSIHLQKPEAKIFQLLAPRLPSMRMLDVGVGGGRTTRHLASRVREYVGVDSSQGMVDSCRKEFGPTIRFELCDMRVP